MIRVREKTLNTNLPGIKCFVRENDTVTGLEKVITEILIFLGSKQNVNLHRDAREIVDMYMKYPECRWLKHFTVAKEYYNKYGTIAGIPHIIDGFHMKSFLGAQRSKYHLYENTIPLSTKQKELLDSIEFEYRRGLPFGILKEIDTTKNNVKLTDSRSEKKSRLPMAFDDAIRYAERFYKQNGHLYVPLRYEDGDFKLGDWIGWMRKKYYGKNNTVPLTQEQIDKLESMGMIWDVPSYEWEQKYNLAKQYYDTFGTINIGRHVEYQGVKLGRWLDCHREIWKGTRKGKLTEEQIDKLNELKFNWMQISDDIETYNKLLDVYNHCAINIKCDKKAYISCDEYSWMKKYLAIKKIL